MKTINIGKSTSNDFVINDETVSRLHATLSIMDNGDIIIKDLNSTNGTFVNGRKIISPQKLEIGNIVRLGNRVLDWQSLGKMGDSSHNVQLPEETVASKTLGRDIHNNICYHQSDVSSYHAVLCKKKNGTIVLVDCHSTNGTYINGEKINGERILNPGDVVLLCNKYPFNWASIFPTQLIPSVRSRKPIVLGVAIALAVVIGVGLALWLIPKKPMEASEIYAMYKKSVVMIYEENTYSLSVDGKRLSSYWEQLSALDYCYCDENKEIKSGMVASTGTGFFISEDGKIMTNKHVVKPIGQELNDAKIIHDKASSLMLKLANSLDDADVRNSLRYLAKNLEVEYTIIDLRIARNDSHVQAKSDMIPCTLFKVSDNDELDIAIIQTNSKTTPADVVHVISVSDIAEDKNMELGDRVYTIGFPHSLTIGSTEQGLEANNQSGEITQERGEYVYGHNITIEHGASGSPVFDAYGKFAGVIVSGFLTLSQGYNHAISPHAAASLCNNSFN